LSSGLLRAGIDDILVAINVATICCPMMVEQAVAFFGSKRTWVETNCSREGKENKKELI
jgi:hypothetical protein